MNLVYSRVISRFSLSSSNLDRLHWGEQEVGENLGLGVARVRESEHFCELVKVEQGFAPVLRGGMQVEQDSLDQARPVEVLRVLAVPRGLDFVEPEFRLHKVRLRV